MLQKGQRAFMEIRPAEIPAFQRKSDRHPVDFAEKRRSARRDLGPDGEAGRKDLDLPLRRLRARA